MTSPSENTVIVLDCGYDETHEFPADWIFGGANGCSPKADPRWMPTTYQYHDAELRVIHISQTPDCDEEAMDNFTQVAEFGPTFKPVYITVKRPGEEKFVMLPVKYDAATDTVNDA